MRYILSLALLMSACTRANPELVGGGGGSGGSGGAAGSGGGGGTAGSGGTGGGGDMAAGGDAHDMATSQAPDMTSFAGTYCGNMICMKPTNECCVTSAAMVCQSEAVQCLGKFFDCDGPEDCTAPDQCCGSINGSTCEAGGGCSNGGIPLCHTVADCGGHGFVACCGASNGGHLRFCSKNPCM
jgi:hypothetical protein